MSHTLKIFLISSLAIVLANAEMICKLRYDVRNYMNWYNIGSNIIFALYDEPPSEVPIECPDCDRFGNTLGEFHYSLVTLEDSRKYWLNKDEIADSRFFEMLSRLLQVYPLFTEFFGLGI